MLRKTNRLQGFQPKVYHYTMKDITDVLGWSVNKVNVTRLRESVDLGNFKCLVNWIAKHLILQELRRRKLCDKEDRLMGGLKGNAIRRKTSSAP